MFVECRYVLPKGTKCQSPALRGKVYCYFHDRLEFFEQDGQRYTQEPLCLPSLEDVHGIQMALTQILSALGSGRLDQRKAGLYLYGLQLASQILTRVPHTSPDDMVSALNCDDHGHFIAEDNSSLPTIEGNAQGAVGNLGLKGPVAGTRSAPPLMASESSPL